MSKIVRKTLDKFSKISNASNICFIKPRCFPSEETVSTLFMHNLKNFGKIYCPFLSNKLMQVVLSTMRIQLVSTAAHPVFAQLQISLLGAFRRSLAESAVAIWRETAVSAQCLADPTANRAGYLSVVNQSGSNGFSKFLIFCLTYLLISKGNSAILIL